MTRRSRYVCVHGHFYQPPRENPWLEAILPQASAAPYPNWNARILAECYRPNAASRIVDGSSRIRKIANNYSRISFNFGPTLLGWIRDEAADVYRAILAGDQTSAERFGGHGSALAQAYNHMIMPLANERDKHTQVIWGIRDFQHHFGRMPEGMWLPETAVDTPTLEALAAHGIAFTVLAPGQARRVRRIGSPEWSDVGGGQIDPGRVYRAHLPSGRSIDLLFYDGATSSAVAFERLLTDGARFADRLLMRPAEHEPMLSHIATDGETYGHHHRYGDMALAFALDAIAGRDDVRLTNYGEFRALHPAEWEVELHEPSAWSCAHGVGRWSRDCGCSTGGNPGWSQAWREPLRDALDWLRDALIEVFESHGAHLLDDPWAARDDYIDVVVARGANHTPGRISSRADDRADAFLRAHAGGRLVAGGADERRRVFELMEMQRHAQLMYTSCGWFFDELSGLEAVQILRYAARALELGERASGRALEPGFLDRLARARSNIPEQGTGADVYRAHVATARVDLRNVVAHYAVSSLFEDHTGEERVYCYQVERKESIRRKTGKATLAVGTVECRSAITGESASLSFGALHFGDHNLTGGVRGFAGDDAYDRMVHDVDGAFARADLVAVQRALDRHFLELTFSLKSLFPDHQERILDRILELPLALAESQYWHLYDQQAPLMRFLTSHEVPLPTAFRTTAQFILNLQLERALAAEPPDTERIRAGLEEGALVGVELDAPRVGYAYQQAMERAVTALAGRPDDIDALVRLADIAELGAHARIDFDLWRTQNECYKLAGTRLSAMRRLAADGDRRGERWVAEFSRLCAAIHLAV